MVEFPSNAFDHISNFEALVVLLGLMGVLGFVLGPLIATIWIVRRHRLRISEAQSTSNYGTSD